MLSKRPPGNGGRFLFLPPATGPDREQTRTDPRGSTGDTSTMTAAGGVMITRTADQFDPDELTRIAALVDRRRGGVLSSGMEYPGRYTRWHMAYVNPPVEIACRGRQVTARALNDRGLVLMPVIRDAMLRAGVARPEPAPAELRQAEPADGNGRGAPGTV